MTTKSEKAADHLEQNIWVFHGVWFGYFIASGITELL